MSARCLVAILFTVMLSLISWPARAVVPTGQRIDGIPCDAVEGVELHIHAHVSVLDHGRALEVPEDVGRPLAAHCFYWLHTHTPDGIIHIESPTRRSFTLGQFFDIWGVPLNSHDVAGAKPRKGETVKLFVNGQAYLGDPRKIKLARHLDIAIQVGPPHPSPAPFRAWSGN